MEDLIAADSIRREILAQAQQQARQILKEADEEAERELANGRSLAENTEAAIDRECADRIARLRSEVSARSALDRSRILVEFVDHEIRKALDVFFDALPEDRAVRIVLSLVSEAREVFTGKRLRIGRRGLPVSAAQSAAEVLGFHASIMNGEDLRLPSRGLSIETDDGCEFYTATLEIAKERILAERRGELARALCAGTVSLNLGDQFGITRKGESHG
jgi:vacuolar-type H+-ATPase subunit E/Vma4